MWQFYVSLFFFDYLFLSCQLPTAVMERFNQCLISGEPTPEEDQKVGKRQMKTSASLWCECRLMQTLYVAQTLNGSVLNVWRAIMCSIPSLLTETDMGVGPNMEPQTRVG